MNLPIIIKEKNYKINQFESQMEVEKKGDTWERFYLYTKEWNYSTESSSYGKFLGTDETIHEDIYT